jgi:hypothetical protein
MEAYVLNEARGLELHDFYLKIKSEKGKPIRDRLEQYHPLSI